MNCWWIGSGESLCWKCRGWERGMGKLATTNHLKGAILLQCKPFTSREDQGLNWLSWEQKWWQAYQENTDLVFKKKAEGLSPPPAILSPPPPTTTLIYALFIVHLLSTYNFLRELESFQGKQHWEESFRSLRNEKIAFPWKLTFQTSKKKKTFPTLKILCFNILDRLLLSMRDGRRGE